MIDVVMVGAFPPPMNGMAAMNAAVRADLLAGANGVVALDVAAPSLRRDLLSRFGRFPQITRALFRLMCLRRARNRALYMSISGGFGQVYEILFLLMARAKGMRTFLHHHCFAYIDRRSRITGILVAVAGKDATHIALSPGMAARLRSCYRNIGNVVPISNTALLLVNRTEAVTAKTKLATLGFLSNISAEKGVHDFLDVCTEIQKSGLPINALLAGPFESEEIERSVRERLKTLPGVNYIGSVYGDDKKRFYAGIDVLLFPTRYVNEAEPLTIHEAMSNGVPVIAYGRGAISEILDSGCGRVIPVDAGFAPLAMEQIRVWYDRPESLAEASLAASTRFDALGAENARYWSALKVRMLSWKSTVSGTGVKESQSSNRAV